MAFDKTKLVLMEDNLDGKHREWAYRSQDSVATVTGSNYFAGVGATKSAGLAPGQGVSVGDLIHIVVTDSSDVVTGRAHRYFSAVSATTGNATAGGSFT